MIIRKGGLYFLTVGELKAERRVTAGRQLEISEYTRRQVDFVIEKLHLHGGEKVLDLACGFGRHSLELARRGFSVTGIDITPSYIQFAKEKAQQEGICADFFCCDIREIQYDQEFDVVLNMADGAVGYLENEEENRKIFTVVSKALKPGGRHFMDIMNGSYADSHFPCRMWEAGEQCLTLSEFEWDPRTRVMLYGQRDFEYGQLIVKPCISEGNSIRLYTLEEVTEIFTSIGLTVTGSYANFDGKPSSDRDLQLLICSEKR
mgnify:CR=1 FL=1